jgi:hypothetical protein
VFLNAFVTKEYVVRHPQHRELLEQFVGVLDSLQTTTTEAVGLLAKHVADRYTAELERCLETWTKEVSAGISLASMLLSTPPDAMLESSRRRTSISRPRQSLKGSSDIVEDMAAACSGIDGSAVTEEQKELEKAARLDESQRIETAMSASGRRRTTMSTATAVSLSASLRAHMDTERRRQSGAKSPSKREKFGLREQLQEAHEANRELSARLGEAVASLRRTVTAKDEQRESAEKEQTARLEKELEDVRAELSKAKQAIEGERLEVRRLKQRLVVERVQSIDARIADAAVQETQSEAARLSQRVGQLEEQLLALDREHAARHTSQAAENARLTADLALAHEAIEAVVQLREMAVQEREILQKELEDKIHELEELKQERAATATATMTKRSHNTMMATTRATGTRSTTTTTGKSTVTAAKKKIAQTKAATTTTTRPSSRNTRKTTTATISDDK